MKREFLQNLKVGEEALPKEVIDAIMEENGRDITKAKADAVKPYSDYEDIKKERDTQPRCTPKPMESPTG